MQKRIQYMDSLRAMAILGVLLLHAATPYVVLYDEINEIDWQIGIIYNALSRWCVPIFLMISGALLLGRKEEPLGVFFKKRANKILLPFIAWSVIYYAWATYMWSPGYSLKEFFIMLFNNQVYYHLWYFYALIGIYLLVPIFNIFVNHASRQMIGYVIVLWLLFYGGFRYYSYLVSNEFTLFFPLSEYIGFFLLGYYIAAFEIAQKWRIGIYVLGMVGAIETVFRTNVLTEEQGQFTSYAFSYTSPNVIAMSVALFVFVKYWVNRKVARGTYVTSGIIKLIGQTSFGVYLIHAMILDKVRPYFFEGNELFFKPFIAIPMQVFIILVLSTIIVWIIQKIPLLKRIV
ncbi:acyltransferase [Lysinibacillus sphaericus]|uniref:30S ribosomal protein S14 n=1 Tax=Lysinibacillus sphaericus OT4b.31 TaxID=1285586 RepID=R7ZCR1_LYSSH|nr:acyltransferase family protein [Lysinibacillus sphaericus]EON71809.1 30S ribosomal protein S14 [Lysinibacillus sphaericus OT4b.31]